MIKVRTLFGNASLFPVEKRLIVAFLTILVCSFSLYGQVQTRPVSGIVLSEDDGQPVVGASVVAKGTTIGTITDVDGKFRLNVPQSTQTIVFSYIGLITQELPLRAEYNVSLRSGAESLDEVIVVAYGTSTKKSFTGSASVVSSSAIKQIQSPTVTTALDGRAPGVQIVSSTGQPGENPTLRIRGIGSINAGKEPLYIVDGASYDGPISTLNPADIESLTVLKDAAANSLYGARGANGVILITTKNGKQGKLNITLDARWGFNDRAVPDYDVIKAPATYYEQTWKAQYNFLTGTVNPNTENNHTHAEAVAILAGTTSNSLAGKLGNYNNYNVSWSQLIDGNGKLNPNAKLLYRDTWEDALFAIALRQEYNFGVSGGNEKESFYAGLGYLDDNSYAKSSGFERYSSRLRYERQLTSYAKFGTSLAYTRSTQNYPTTAGANYINYFQWVRSIGTIYPVHLHDPVTGAILKDKDGNDRYDYGNAEGYSRPYGSPLNPAGVLEYDVNDITLDNVTGSAFLEASLYEGLKLRGSLDVNTTYKSGSYLRTPLYGDAAGRGDVEKENQKWFSYTASAFLTYNKTFDKWAVDALLGTENYRKEYQYLFGFKTGLALHDVPELGNAVVYSELTSYKQRYSVTGYLARVNLTYNDKYYLSASYRRDGSSRFHPDNRWGNFGSLGLSWRISEEDFLRDITAINDLKLKGSIGSQGNDRLQNKISGIEFELYRPYSDQYTVTNNNGGVSIKQALVGNKDITWEKSLNFNVGIEARFFDRLNFGLEYFYKQTSDLLFSKPLPLSTGLTSIPVNIGKLSNAGFELTADADVVKTRDLVWNVGLNLAHVKNKVLQLPEENRKDGIFSSGYTKLVEGGSIYDIYLPEFAGIDDAGNATWNVYNTDGTFKETTTVASNAYTPESRRKAGSAIPDFTGGFTTDLKWNGFDFSAVLSYQLGGKVYDSVYASLLQTNEAGKGIHKDILNAWTSENTNTDIPRLVLGNVNANGTSDFFLTPASYLSLANVTLGYTLPRSLTGKAKLQSVRLYGTGSNLFLLSARQGLDPRQYDYGSSGFNYSPIRAISFGINVTF
ncbi:MAG: TonB-dependent receptor [Mediterranea sp.]|jgi:TonB-linked SusC/RagA family outer membrane protein|nr:TonB-dependent receptor [Mediterranea sp.]